MTVVKKGTRTSAQWRMYPLRVCRYLNGCDLCSVDIRMGEAYRDGGYGRRAHEYCVDGLNTLEREATRR